MGAGRGSCITVGVDGREYTEDGLLVVPCCYGTMYLPPDVGCHCDTPENRERDRRYELYDRIDKAISDLERVIVERLLPEPERAPAPVVSLLREPPRFPLLRDV